MVLVQKNRVALWLMLACAFPIEITKEGPQSLRMKIRNAELYFKEATVFRHPLAAGLPKLASKTRMTAPTCSTPNAGASFQLITRLVSDDTKLLRFASLR